MTDKTNQQNRQKQTALFTKTDSFLWRFFYLQQRTIFHEIIARKIQDVVGRKVEDLTLHHCTERPFQAQLFEYASQCGLRPYDMACQSWTYQYIAQ